MYGCGVKHVNICYGAGRENTNADALSRSPRSPAPAFGTSDGEIQVAAESTCGRVGHKIFVHSQRQR